MEVSGNGGHGMIEVSGLVRGRVVGRSVWERGLGQKKIVAKRKKCKREKYPRRKKHVR
jgi:hypothetical protein